MVETTATAEIKIPVDHTGFVISTNAPKWVEAAVKLGYAITIAPTDEKPNNIHSEDRFHKFTLKRDFGGPYLNDVHEEFDKLLHE